MAGTSGFTLYRSSDASAPQLTGSAGSLIAVLSAVLVNGYGSQPAAGWTLAFTGTNLAAYKMASTTSTSASSTGAYLYVNDAGPGAGTYKEARITGYLTMASISSGAGQFPSATASQGPAAPWGFLVARKSNTLDSTTYRPWVCFADGTTFYFLCQTGDSANVYESFSFGDFYSQYGTSDLWRCLLIARAYENSGTTSTGGLDNVAQANSTSGSSTGGNTGAAITHYCCSSWATGTGTGTSLAVGKHGDLAKGAFTSNEALVMGYGAATLQTPNGPDNSLYLAPVMVHEISGPLVRGQLRGMWNLCHAVGNFTDGQTFTGVGQFAGKTFYIAKTLDNGGCLAFETSNTLISN